MTAVESGTTATCDRREHRARPSRPSISRRGWRAPVLLALASVALLLQAAPAGAVFRPDHSQARPALPTDTEMTMTGTGAGQGVNGFIANAGNSFDPAKQDYPSLSDPTEAANQGFTPKSEGFAGIIHGTPKGGGATLELYCIDIRTDTYDGIGYALGTWDATNVPNVGFVARILNDFFPTVPEQPAGLNSDNARAAAVQAAIWYFSDKYVLNTLDPLHAAVVSIVNAVKTSGPLVQPPPPSLTITPSDDSGPAGSAVGPFTVTTNAPPATVTAVGADMFSNAAGTAALPDPASVPSGKKIWVRSTGPSSAKLRATSKATVPTGNVYLYAGNNAGVNDAQRLILAQSATLTTTVNATAEFLPPGSLVVEKTIAGPAVGSQGQVVIDVDCDDGVTRADFIIDARTGAGAKTKTYEDIPAGTKCTVTETSDGTVVGTAVAVIRGQQNVTIPSGERAMAHITDTYRFVGALLVRKTIAGPAAGQQGEITIHTTCDGKALTPDFVIPAGSPAGDQTKQYDDIDAPATCTVTETVDGHTSTVPVVVTGNGQTASVPAGQVTEVDITDTYGAAPSGAVAGVKQASGGSLLVTKTIGGPLARRHGRVIIRVACNGTARSPDFVVSANARAGRVTRSFDGIPAGSSCTVTETANGATADVAVTVVGSGRTITVPGGRVVPVNVTNVYRAASGALKVTKTIAGSAARRHGRIAILVACGGPLRVFAFLIPAHTAAGSVSRHFPDLPGTSRCVVTETAAGGTRAVAVVARGHRRVVIRPNRSVTAHLVDRFSLATSPRFTG